MSCSTLFRTATHARPPRPTGSPTSRHRSAEGPRRGRAIRPPAAPSARRRSTPPAGARPRSSSKRNAVAQRDLFYRPQGPAALVHDEVDGQLVERLLDQVEEPALPPERPATRVHLGGKIEVTSALRVVRARAEDADDRRRAEDL